MLFIYEYNYFIYFLIIWIDDVEIEVNFIFILHTALSSTINMVHELNHQLLTSWNHYSWVAFYIYHNLLKHM